MPMRRSATVGQPRDRLRLLNEFELTGAGLTPRCADDNWAAGVRCSEGLDDEQDWARRDGAGVVAWMRRVSPGSLNRGALDGDDFTPHSPLRVSSNGFELTGAGLTPNQNDDNWAAGVRCSEVLDDAFICKPRVA